VTHFYYANTDENGVLCVDQIDWDTSIPTVDDVAHNLAQHYTDVIYFTVEAP
jgi:hypothetical protein